MSADRWKMCNKHKPHRKSCTPYRTENSSFLKHITCSQTCDIPFLPSRKFPLWAIPKPSTSLCACPLYSAKCCPVASERRPAQQARPTAQQLGGLIISQQNRLRIGFPSDTCPVLLFHFLPSFLSVTVQARFALSTSPMPLLYK